MFGQLLYGAFGTLATSVDDPEAGANTHTFSVLNTNQNPTYSIVLDDDVRAGAASHVVLASKLSRLEVRVVAGEYVTYEATFVGRKPEATTEAPSFVAETDFVSAEATAKFAATVAGLGGASTVPLESLTLTIERNTEPHFAFGSVAPNQIVNKQLSVTGEAVLLFENSTYYDLFTANTVQALLLSLVSGTDIGATSTAFQIDLQLDELVFPIWSDPRPLDDKVMQTVELRGQYNTTTSAMINGTLINAEANAVY